MKTITLTIAQAKLINRKPLIGKSIACKPRGAVYSSRGTALPTFNIGGNDNAKNFSDKFNYYSVK